MQRSPSQPQYCRLAQNSNENFGGVLWKPLLGINELTVKHITKKEKEICEAVAADTPTTAEPLHKPQGLHLVESATFFWVQDCHKKDIPVDSDII